MLSDYPNLTNFVIPYYSEPHRSYHTFEHIERILSDAEKMDIKLSPAQIIAILFHDIIYTPGSTTNEKDSARMLQWVSKMYPEWLIADDISTNDINDACTIIEDTQHHTPSSDHSKIVIDLDLLGLADDYANYVGSGKNVRAEFGYLSENDWMVGRLEFLSSLIKREHIFQTDDFRNQFDEKAKNNMNQERNGILDTLKILGGWEYEDGHISRIF